MAKILVTGANGQLGSELRALAPQYKQHSFLFSDLPEVNITDAAYINQYITQENPQFVINCAAYTAVDKAESDFELATQINATAVRNLATACVKINAYFIHISTDYVFDGKSYLPYQETDRTNPQTAYGVTKLEGEKFALSYTKSIVIRTAWLYSTFGKNFVKTMLNLGNTQPSINVVADQVGTPTNAADLAAVILQITDKIAGDEKSFAGGVFHFSNEGVCSWYDFSVEIMRLAKLPCKVLPIDTKDYPTPAHRPAYSVLHKGKIKQTYGISIAHWCESLEKCIKQLV